MPHKLFYGLHVGIMIFSMCIASLRVDAIEDFIMNFDLTSGNLRRRLNTLALSVLSTT